VLVLLSALIVAGALFWVGLAIARELAAIREDEARRRALELLALFAPGVSAAAEDARALLTWQPLATTARTLLASDFARLDQAAGGRFPFTADQIDAAHARWSTDWLTWEGTHDAAYKLKAAQIEAEIAAGGATPLARARLDAVEREKLEVYQRRYSEYVRVSKALQTLRT
jgi:hypothetical protein